MGMDPATKQNRSPQFQKRAIPFLRKLLTKGKS